MLVAICGLQVIFSNVATANASNVWPKEVEFNIGSVVAHEEDTLSLIRCADFWTKTGNTAAFIKNGSINAAMVPVERNSCLASSGYHEKSYHASPDGKLFVANSIESGYGTSSQGLVLWSGDRKIWRVEVDANYNCPTATNSITGSRFSSMVVGVDGVLYAIAGSTQNACSAFLVAISPDGNILYKKFLSNKREGANIRGERGKTAHLERIWLYDDEIIVVDSNANVRHFNYNGEEDFNRRFAIPLASNETITTPLIANSAKRIFGSIRGPKQSCGYDRYNIESFYYDANGTTNYGKIANDIGCGASPVLNPTADGGAVIFDARNNMFKRLKPGVASSPNSLPLVPTGYTRDWSTGHWENENGDMIVVRMLINNQTKKRTAVVLKKQAGVNQWQTLFNMEDHENIQDLANPYPFDIINDYMYLSFCRSNCSATDGKAQTVIHKISLQGFGNPIRDTSLHVNQDIDRDGDGIDDFVESQWNPNRDALFCGAECAYPDPAKKDIYLEIDWMNDGNRSFKPNETQINYAKQVFSDRDIQLHIDTGQYGGGNELPGYVSSLPFRHVEDQVDFADYKNGTGAIEDANFDSDRLGIWRYAIAGNSYADSPASSGAAYAGGGDMFVSYGLIHDNQAEFDYTDIDIAIAGTIVHELGHGLCLSDEALYQDQPNECIYEGVDNPNASVDYVSSMNYRYQMSQLGYSNGQNGSVNDHNDWLAIGKGIAEYARRSSLFGASNFRKMDESTIVHGVSLSEARKLSKHKMLGEIYRYKMVR